MNINFDNFNHNINFIIIFIKIINNNKIFIYKNLLFTIIIIKIINDRLIKNIKNIKIINNDFKFIKTI